MFVEGKYTMHIVTTKIDEPCADMIFIYMMNYLHIYNHHSTRLLHYVCGIMSSKSDIPPVIYRYYYTGVTTRPVAGHG